MFEESLVGSVILQPILHRKPVRTDCSAIDGKVQLKHASAAKKSDKNKNKNIKSVTRCKAGVVY